MALTLAEHLKIPVIEKICPLCQQPIQEGEPLGKRFIDMAEVCTDCYFDGLGNQNEGYSSTGDKEGDY